MAAGGIACVQAMVVLQVVGPDGQVRGYVPLRRDPPADLSPEDKIARAKAKVSHAVAPRVQYPNREKSLRYKPPTEMDDHLAEVDDQLFGGISDAIARVEQNPAPDVAGRCLEFAEAVMAEIFPQGITPPGVVDDAAASTDLSARRWLNQKDGWEQVQTWKAVFETVERKNTAAVVIIGRYTVSHALVLINTPKGVKVLDYDGLGSVVLKDFTPAMTDPVNSSLGPVINARVLHIDLATAQPVATGTTRSLASESITDALTDQANPDIGAPRKSGNPPPGRQSFDLSSAFDRLQVGSSSRGQQRESTLVGRRPQGDTGGERPWHSSLPRDAVLVTDARTVYLPLDSLGNVLSRGALSETGDVLVFTDLAVAMAWSFGEVAEVTVPAEVAVDLAASSAAYREWAEAYPEAGESWLLLPNGWLEDVELSGVVHVDAGPLGIQELVAMRHPAPLRVDTAPQKVQGTRPPRRPPVGSDETPEIHNIILTNGTVLGLHFLSEEEFQRDYANLVRYDPAHREYGQRIDASDSTFSMGGMVDHFPLPWKGEVFVAVVHGFPDGMTMRFSGGRKRTDFGYRMGLVIRQHPRFRELAERYGYVTIVLLACETGIRLDGPAQHLADAIGAPHRVFAPTGDTGVVHSGELRVIVDGRNLNVPDWREFRRRAAQSEQRSVHSPSTYGGGYSGYGYGSQGQGRYSGYGTAGSGPGSSGASDSRRWGFQPPGGAAGPDPLRMGVRDGGPAPVAPEQLKAMLTTAVKKAAGEQQNRSQQFPWSPPPTTLETCLVVASALAGQLFPRLFRHTRDDNATSTRAQRWLGRPKEDWTTEVPDYQTLIRGIAALGEGGAGLVVEHPPGENGHAYLIVNTTERQYRTEYRTGPLNSETRSDLASLGAAGGSLTPTSEHDNRALPRTRVLLITPTGDISTPTSASVFGSGHTNADALTDPSNPHIGMHPFHRPGPPRSHTPAPPRSSQPAQPVPPAVAVVNAARQYVDHLRWRGGSAPSPRDGWQISQTIGGGNHVNDFARWIRGLGDMPNRDSTMTCNEAIFFVAYRAGVIDLTWLQRVYAHATKRASSFYRHFLRSSPGANLFSLPDVGDGYGHGQMTEPEVLFQSTLTDYLAPGPHHRYDINPHTGVGAPDIPAGHVILFDGINGHVALSLGTRDSRGRQQVISHWNRPQNIPPGPGVRRPTGFLQITTVEDLLFSGHGNTPRFHVIEFATPPWASPATMVVAAARQLRGKLRWRGGYGADPSSGWRVNETTNNGFPNDMALWLHGKGPEPNEDSTMNCWDGILFSAYRAGVIDKPWIERLYATAASVTAEKARRYVDPRTNNYIPYSEPDRYGKASNPPQTTFNYAVMEGMAFGPLQRYMINPSTGVGYPDIPPGYIIFFDGAYGHVAISLGTRDAQGRLEVMNHWTFPRTLPNRPDVGFMQPTTIEEIAHGHNQVIEFGAPRWGTPAGGSSASSGSSGSSGSLDSWTRGAGGRAQAGLPISGSVPAGSRLSAPGGSPETTAAISDTAGAEGPAGGARKTVIGSDGVVWSSSSFSEDECVNVAVVWMDGD